MLAVIGAALIVLVSVFWLVEADDIGDYAVVAILGAIPFACCLWAIWRAGAYARRGEGEGSAVLAVGVASLVYFLLGGMLSLGLLAVWQTVLTVLVLTAFGAAVAARRVWRRF